VRLPETPIVLADFTVTEPFRTWANKVSRNIPYTGVGSPEGVVVAPQYSEYINTTGSAGAIKWIKMQPDIGGDRSQGWVLL
jgi:hypothetical protein